MKARCRMPSRLTTFLLVITLLVFYTMFRFLSHLDEERKSQYEFAKQRVQAIDSDALSIQTSHNDDPICMAPLQTQRLQMEEAHKQILLRYDDKLRKELDKQCTHKLDVLSGDHRMRMEEEALRRGNHMEDTKIYEQTKSKRRWANRPVISKVPSFELLTIPKDGIEYLVMNDRLVSPDTEFDLIILIPSLARFNETTPMDYLDRVLTEYSDQLKDIRGTKKILIIVHAFEDEKYHHIFHECHNKFREVTEMVFLVPPGRFKDPYKDIPGVKYDSPTNSYPGRMARQQTCDVLQMTNYVLKTFKFKYLLFSEDDFVPCPGMFTKIFTTLSAIEEYHANPNIDREKGFCSLKLTLGLGGTILSRQAAELFLDHSKNNIDLNPVDVLIDFTLYYRGEGYKTCITENLTSYVLSTGHLIHIGGVSNWKERNNKKLFKDRNFDCALKMKIDWHFGKAIGLREVDRNCTHDNVNTVPCV